MRRLFTAIELAPALRQAVVAYQSQAARLVDPGGRALRLTPPDQFHLTLVFLGQIDDGLASRIQALMKAPLDSAPFTLTTGAAGVFASRGTPKVWWLGIEQGLPALEHLHRVLSRRLVEAGVVLEQRAYQPHLTLGRWRERERGLRVPTLPAPPVMPAQQVTEVTLFESRLHARGAEHRVLARAPLVGATAPLH